ncbi:MAG: patatin-like phospholipase family protein [Pseudomonadota bacterium]|nr:patatin-like phospholipase family protein [Pseudomonadota bacterium]
MRIAAARPGELHDDALSAIRYVLNFAKLLVIRDRAGVDHDVQGFMASHAWKVRDALTPHLLEEPSLWGAMRVLPELVALTRDRRTRLLEHFPLDRDSLEAEVTTRQLVVVCGGGGGAGYGYAGAWTLFHRRGLQPELIAGTSIGSLLGLFRARRRVFDGAPLVAAAKRLSWETVFRVLQIESRYGLPATLRLYLRSAIGSLFETPDGRPLTFRDLEIPLLIVTTGIGVEALKHDLSYYEHFLDDAVRPGVKLQVSTLAKVGQVATIFRELLSTPDALREVVFGSDPATYDADVLDAAGFSSSIPGLIHYDVLRDDRRMKVLLDELYARYGITRLAEGGIVNNVPVRPAFTEAMSGRLVRRNPYIVALDCFPPRMRAIMFYGVQQIVRPNVLRNIPYANTYLAMERTLSPLNLVPNVPDVNKAMNWTMEELEPHMPVIERMCTPFRPI